MEKNSVDQIIGVGLIAALVTALAPAWLQLCLTAAPVAANFA